jgi:hypothetical protein
MSRWTEDRDKVLTRLWQGGDSAGDISRAMRITRNAVLGRLYWLGPLGDRKTRARPVAKQKIDPQNQIDTRDLAILDELVAGASLVETARAFGVAPSYVGELWAAREACG